MNKLNLKLIFMLIFSLWLSSPIAKAEELWLKDISVQQLQDLYKQCGYDGARGYLMLPNLKYPPIFLKNFPTDYTAINDETERNALFIKILTPLALKVNQEIRAERQIILDMSNKIQKGQKLTSAEIKQLESTAEKYDVFTRLKEDDRYTYLTNELLTRVDIIPPSILVTAAAIETNWGTSRIVKEGNSLYKTLVWHTKEGLNLKAKPKTTPTE